MNKSVRQKVSAVGRKVDKIFLLRQSTDLVALIPAVLAVLIFSYSFDFFFAVKKLAAIGVVHYTMRCRKADGKFIHFTRSLSG